MFAYHTDNHESVFFTQEQAVLEIFPQSDRIENVELALSNSALEAIENELGYALDHNQLQLIKIFKNDSLIGYGVILNELGKHKPITFFTGISVNFKIKDVVVMVYREKIGSDVRKKRFLKQFINKSADDHITIDDDIHGISGATISSWSIASGVRKALHLIQHFI